MSDSYLAELSISLGAAILRDLESYYHSQISNPDPGAIAPEKGGLASTLQSITEGEVKRAFASYMVASQLGIQPASLRRLERLTDRFSENEQYGTKPEREAGAELARVIWLRSVTLSDAEVESMIEVAGTLGIHDSVITDLRTWAADRSQSSD